jgi:transketolase
VIATTCPTRMRILGIPGEFAPTGSEEFLLEHFGLTAKGIERAAVDLLKTAREA